ncbi:MAG TPA: hypothetical protein VLY23_12545 [Candidatus Acidoferrum sp.]|nr:hypothetical protein [Candidatus Acidoferrum sp.]
MRKLFSISFSAMLLTIGIAQGTWAQRIIVAGPYPGGTWAELHDINDSGVAVGWGDVPGGDIRMIGVSLSDPNHPRWFESGVSSNEPWCCEGGGIAATGLIVGHVQDANGEARAYAWMVGDHKGIDLGTLVGDNGSAAIAVNNSGTLIVGNSYRWNADQTSWWATPVAWTPVIKWHNGRPTVSWVIHALPTGGLEQSGAVFENTVLNNWSGWGVNDLGQIVGDGWSDAYDEIAVFWNPAQGGKGWQIRQLPHQSSSPAPADFVYTEALSINNLGEISGDVSSDYWNTQLAVVWKNASQTKSVWTLTPLATLSGTQIGASVAYGINDRGNVLGVSMDANGNELATLWRAKDPGTPTIIGFPGDYSRAMQENIFGIVVGRYSYGGGPVQAAAVGIH